MNNHGLRPRSSWNERVRMTSIPFVFLLLFGCFGNSFAKLQIVTTTPNLAAIAQAVGGDLVETRAIAGGAQDPHYVQARPSYARLMNRADLVIANGLELEVGWLGPLLESARNPRIRPGSAGFLDASTTVDRILEVPSGSVDRSQGDVHPFGNPHYDLDPRNGVLLARGIGRALSAVDSGHASTYGENAERYAAQLESKIATWKGTCAGLTGAPMVGFHKEWEYLADWLGFHMVGYVEDRAGIPPSPQHLAELAATLERLGTRRILRAPYNDERACRGVAERAGATVLTLPTQVGATPEIRTYEDLIGAILDPLCADIGERSH